MTVIYLVTGSGTNATWNVPADWNSANNTIEVIGGGGGGSSAVVNNTTGAGAGGAAYSLISNLTLTPSGTATYTVGLGGAISTTGGDSWFNGTSLGGSSVGAKGGGGASLATFGPGGLASGGVGSTKFSGGDGGTEGNQVNGGSGGGGAAGPGGAGAKGGDSGFSAPPAYAEHPGGGGGGNGGGGAGVLPPSDTTGGAGGTAVDSTAGGAGGAGNSSGTAGSHGSGGGGGGSNTAANNDVGGAGGAGLDLGDGTKGSGGGGGGGGGRFGAGTVGGTGGAGGLYGGGGGGGGWVTTGGTTGIGGVGADGLIVITYAPAASAPPVGFEMVPGGDMPWRRDYRVALAATTQPVSPVFIPQVAVAPDSGTSWARWKAGYRIPVWSTTYPVGPIFIQTAAVVATPDVMSELVLGEDNPRRPDYRTTLASTTRPVGISVPPPPAQTPTFLFNLEIGEDNPRRPDYSRALAATTSPVGPKLQPTVTPDMMGNLTQGEDLPRRRDYSRALESTTHPVLQVPSTIAQTPLVLSNLTIGEDNPRRRDYSRVLAATTSPTPPVFIPTVTPAEMSDLSLGEDLPRRADYRAVLASTTSPPIVVFVQPVAATPSTYFDLSLFEDLPRRRDYRAALSPAVVNVTRYSACPDIPQFVWDGSIWDCAIWGGNPSQFQATTIGFEGLARNYRVVLASTTRPVGGPHGVLPTPTVTPSVMGDLSLQDDRPQRKNYFATLNSNTPRVVFNPCANMVQNGGFESGALSPWVTDGDVSSGGSGVDTSSAHARFGNDSGYVFTAAAHTAYVALRQPVTVAPNTVYTASAWINMFNTGGTGCFTVTNGANDTDIVTMGIPDTGTSPPSAGGYARFSQQFNSGAQTTVNVQVGYFAVIASGGSVTPTQIDAGMDVTVASSYVTASIAPFVNQLTIVAVASNAASGNTLPTVTGAGGTWVQIATQLDAGSIRRTTLFRDLTASPGTGQLTIDFAGNSQTNCGWSITSFSGVDTSGTHGSGAIVQNAGATVAGTSTGLVVTLGGFASPNNVSYGFIRNNTTGAISQGSGFTTLANQVNFTTVNAEWKPNDTTVDWTWASQTVDSVGIAIEIAASTATGSSFNLDDVSLVPAICDPITPPWFKLAVGEDRPRLRNFQAALFSPPVGPKLIPTVTPVPTFDWVTQEDNPRRPNYRTVLASTTTPVGPALIATVTPTPTFDWITQEDNPRRSDYRAALASTSAVVGPTFQPTAPTPDTRADVVTPGPQAKDYSRVLEATTHPVGPLVGFIPIQVSSGVGFLSVQPMPQRPDYSRVLAAPAVIRFPMRPPQCAKWDEGNFDYDYWCDANAATPIVMASVITPEPQRPDYSRALESTTQQVGQLYGNTPAVVTPSIGFLPPAQQLPGRRDYRVALESTTRPRTSRVFPAETQTPTRWTDSAFDPNPLQKDYSRALYSTTAVTRPLRDLPFVPPEPPVEVCVVPLPGGGGPAVVVLPGVAAPGTVALTPGTGSVVALSATPTPGTVTLTGTTQGSTPLDPNPDCP